jgi:hypothetical protein
MKVFKRNRRSKEEGELAHHIRRKMIQRNHGNKTIYIRKKFKIKDV